jgi:hypothetical protein
VRFRSTTGCAALVVCALIVALAECSEEYVDPPPASLVPTMKGFGLYSWRDGQTWMLKLMVGTNRIRTLDEVTSDGADPGTDVLARGIQEMKAALGQLPDGAQVAWRGPEALERMGVGLDDLVLPPEEMRRTVTAIAERAGITLGFVQ